MWTHKGGFWLLSLRMGIVILLTYANLIWGSTSPSTNCKSGLNTVITGPIVNVPEYGLAGIGGHGSVRKGVADDGMTPIAIKAALGADTRQYLDREATYLQVLNEDGGHPAIPKTYGIKKTPEGEAVLVTEWIEGTPYKRYVAEEKINHENFKDKTRLFLTQMKELYSGLNFIHSRNVLHLDIKPENIMIQKDGRLRIIDFGIASGFIQQDGRYVLTEEKLGYSKKSAAPELKDKVNGKEVVADISPASDFYSLGHIMSQWAKVAEGPLQKEPLTTKQKQLLLNIGDLINRLKRTDPAQRPSSIQIEEAFQSLETELNAL